MKVYIARIYFVYYHIKIVKVMSFEITKLEGGLSIRKLNAVPTIT